MKSFDERRRIELGRLAAGTGSLCRRALTVALLVALEVPMFAQDAPSAAAEPAPAAG